MAAGVEDIELEAGAAFRMRLIWTEPDVPAPTEDDPSATVPGLPYDLTGAIAHMQIRLAPGTPVLVDLINGDGITLGGDTGAIEVYISAQRTAALTVKKARYDLYVTLAGGDRLRVLQGKVTISPAITVDVP